MNRSSIDIVRIIRNNNLRVFTTSDIRTLTNMTQTAMTTALNRLAQKEIVLRLKKGVWSNKIADHLNPYEAMGYLRAPWPSYVSLYSALADHGVIEEIPHILYGVTSARRQHLQTPIGRFHIHHIPAHLMWGYEIKKTGNGQYPLAEPEKAFLDLMYLSLIPRSGLSMPVKRSRRWALDKKKLQKYAKRFHFPVLLQQIQKI